MTRRPKVDGGTMVINRGAGRLVASLVGNNLTKTIFVAVGGGIAQR